MNEPSKEAIKAAERGVNHPTDRQIRSDAVRRAYPIIRQAGFREGWQAAIREVTAKMKEEAERGRKGTTHHPMGSWPTYTARAQGFRDAAQFIESRFSEQ